MLMNVGSASLLFAMLGLRRQLHLLVADVDLKTCYTGKCSEGGEWGRSERFSRNFLFANIKSHIATIGPVLCLVHSIQVS